MFDPDSLIPYWVNRLGFLIRRDIAQRFQAAGHDVSPEEWAILLMLWKHGRLAPSILADLTIKDRTTITRLVDGMVRKRLVRRLPDPEDRRRMLISPSEQGAALRDHLVPLARDLIDTASAEIPAEDLETTRRTLRAMVQNLHAPQKAQTKEGAAP